MKEKSKKVSGIVLIGIMSLATMGLPPLVGVAQSHDQPQGTTEGIIMEFVGEIEASGDVPSPCPFAVPVLDGLVDDVYLDECVGYIYNNVSYPNCTGYLWFIDNTSIDPTYIWLVWKIHPGFVDNTYGANIIGQYRNPGGGTTGHIFDDLLESDRQQIKVYSTTGSLILDALMGYLDGPPYGGPYGTPSGYDVSWDEGDSTKTYINGGDWSKAVYNTSLCYDVNYYYGVDPNVLVDSPGTDDNYTTNTTYPNWEYAVIYELRLDRSIFGSGINGSATEFLALHASPNKAGIKDPDLPPGEEIPEFSTLLIPIIGMIALFAIFRKYKKK